MEVNSGNPAAAERLLKDLSDPALKKIYTSNVIAKAMQLNQCEIGRPLISKLNDKNLEKLWASNYKYGC